MSGGEIVVLCVIVAFVFWVIGMFLGEYMATYNIRAGLIRVEAGGWENDKKTGGVQFKVRGPKKKTFII